MQFDSAKPCGSGWKIEYRRGVPSSRKNDLWHWRLECRSFPTRSFQIRKDKPTDDDLCARCASVEREAAFAVQI